MIATTLLAIALQSRAVSPPLASSADHRASPITAALLTPRGAPASPLAVLPVEYDADKVPTIYTKIRFATAIVFPEPEKIVEVICGDKEWWQIAGPDRIVYVKPSRAGISTNLTVIGASGNIYSFFLQEISRDEQGYVIDKNAGDALPLSPHAKVTMRLPETLARKMESTGPKYVPKVDMDEALQAADQRVQAATDEARNVKTAAAKALDQEVTRVRTNYPAALQFNYRIQLDTKPFFVRAMFADDRFTYIKVDSQEAPAVYEIKDGKPSLVNFDFVNGVFVIRKVVDQGYLAIGKAKLPFTRAQR
jgi:type IV secretion system protein VirB9